MAQSHATDPFAQVAQRYAPHSMLRRAWELKGGVSAQVTALEIERADGQSETLVVRRYGATDLASDPHIAAHEFALLACVRAAGVAAPTPYLYDESGQVFAMPYLVEEFIDGESLFAIASGSDAIAQLASALATIHSIDRTTSDLAFLPNQEHRVREHLRNRPPRLDESIGEQRIRDTLEAVWPPVQRNATVLLHGDFWPGNILWRAGRLVAVIDWEDAAVGDPLADIASARLELLWAFGSAAMNDFTSQYRARSSIDFANLPYWELRAALRPAFQIGAWAANKAAEQTMRERHAWFVAQAYDALAHDSTSAAGTSA